MPDNNKVIERRRSKRMETSILAVAKTGQGARHRVQISDLSVGGCAVVSLGVHPLRDGLAYGVKIDGLETLGAVAAWTAGSAAGLEFAQALHPAVADHLAKSNPPPADEAGEAEVS